MHQYLFSVVRVLIAHVVRLDYIRLVETAFAPRRHDMYNTPGDMDALRKFTSASQMPVCIKHGSDTLDVGRGKVLYDGLFSFKRRLEQVQEGLKRRALVWQVQGNIAIQVLDNSKRVDTQWEESTLESRGVNT